MSLCFSRMSISWEPDNWYHAIFDKVDNWYHQVMSRWTTGTIQLCQGGQLGPSSYVKVDYWDHPVMSRWTTGTGKQEYKYLSCVPGVDGKIHPEGVVQHRRWRGLPSHRLAARSPRDGFFHPQQEHMIDTFSCIFYFI